RSELVPVVRLFFWSKVATSVKRVVAKELEYRRMKSVRSGLCLYVHNAAAGTSEFGAVCARRQLEFFDRIDRRDDHQLVVTRVIVVHAVKQKVVFAARHAVRVEGRRLTITALNIRQNTRAEQRQRHKMTRV